MRTNQLKRSITALSSSTEDEKVRLLSNQLLEDYFSVENKFGGIYEILNQINLLGQIYARMVSLLVTEDITDALIYKLYGMIRIGEITITKLSTEELSHPIDDGLPINIARTNLVALQDEIKTFKKKENYKITNFEGLFKHLINEAPHLYKQLNNVKTFSNLLGLAFGVEDQAKDIIKQIEHINIKELLFISELTGELIHKIFIQYDGLLTYTMSLLTMLCRTEYESKFKIRLNSILEALSTSTLIILLQQRLLKNIEQKRVNDEQQARLKEKIINKSLELKMELEEETLEKIFNFLNQPYEIRLLGVNKIELAECGEMTTVFSNSGLILLKAQIIDLWNEKYEIAHEFSGTLHKITEYFESIIRKTNTITADLFAKGFRAAIPLYDVEICEKAGVHLKNITATSSTQKIFISDIFFDTKLKLYRLYESNWTELRRIIKQKAREEQAIQSLSERNRIFSKIYNGLEEMTVQWNVEAIFTGRGEEVVIASHILFTVVQLLQQMWNAIIPFKKDLLSNETLSEFQRTSEMLRDYWNQFQKIYTLSLIINHIGKRIWYLNREFVIIIAEEEKYFKHPETIHELIADIPKVLDQEYRQKLITKEIRRQKMDIYNELLTNIEELSNIPTENRELLMDFQIILAFIEVNE